MALHCTLPASTAEAGVRTLAKICNCGCAPCCAHDVCLLVGRAAAWQLVFLPQRSHRAECSSHRESCLPSPAPLTAADYLQQQKLAAAAGADPTSDGAPPSAERLQRQWQRVMLTSLAEDPGEAWVSTPASNAGCSPCIMMHMSINFGDIGKTNSCLHTVVGNNCAAFETSLLKCWHPCACVVQACTQQFPTSASSSQRRSRPT